MTSMLKLIGTAAAVLFTQNALGAEWMMKMNRRMTAEQLQAELRASGRQVTEVQDLRFGGWFLVKTATESLSGAEAQTLGRASRAVWVEANKKIRVQGWASGRRPLNGPRPSVPPGISDDPVFQQLPPRGNGIDPFSKSQWYLQDIGFPAVAQFPGNGRLVVAIIDTGVDYNHPELNGSIAINQGEAGPLSNNGIDDDKNGYIDDFMGWDFSENDNTPFDKTGGGFGNPGHGTHCAGVVAAATNNAFGITGIASGVRIMPLRFMNENGEGTTADAVKAVKYAVDNGAAILSNSWGGADENNDDSRALREIMADASNKNRLILAAAGNEASDVDAEPLASTPASFNLPNQITVAASDREGKLADFSNHGAKLVHMAAPGVDINSTIPGGKFMNMDGTSMATPITAGALALFWSMNPQMNAAQVKDALLTTVQKSPELEGSTITGGKLDLQALMAKGNQTPPPGLRFRRK